MSTYESIMRCLNPGFLPTPQQREVIESQSPAILVVAGAGSGKTATMTNRIAYEIATGAVRPGEVLGLTFTRKAAGELATRVDQAIITLRRGGFLGSQEQDVRTLREQMERPTIATYNSFAAEIAASYGMLIGADPGARLITDAERWQLMEEIVAGWPDRAEDEILRASAQSTIISDSLSLAAALIDNQRTTDEAREFFDIEADSIDFFARDTSQFRGAELKAIQPGWKHLKDAPDRLRRRRAMLDMVDAYLSRKRSLGVVEFADQVATAVAVLEAYPTLGEELAQRHRLVLLDEYQDTSVSQANFLSRALAPASSGASEHTPWRSVCAVGDPYQAIYGWRGASASALADFAREFGRRMGGVEQLSLATSFRNDRAILDAANAVAGKIEARSLPVKGLSPRPDAGPGSVTEIRTLLREDSYRGIAWRIRDVMRSKSQGSGAEIAVLCRKRKYIEPMVEALTEVDVPYEIVGGESLLQRPEILTIRAALATVATPGRNDQLMRLLTFVGVGAQDVRALAEWAQVYAARQIHELTLPSPVPGASTVPDTSTAPEDSAPSQVNTALDETDAETHGTGKRPPLKPRDEGTLIEALTYLPHEEWAGRHGASFTPQGRAQLGDLSDMLHKIRGAIHNDLSDLIAYVAQIFGLDLASATRTSGSQRVRTSIDSFITLGGVYQREHPGTSMADFLEWLEASDEKEHSGEDEAGIESARLDEDIDVRPGVVQIMTIHSAKGLEWNDLVAIPEVVDGEFSDIASGATSWLTRTGEFPFPLRADYEHLPHFRPSQCEDKFDAAKEAMEFKETALPEYESQEARRLAYVAFTRPRAELVLAGYGLKSPEKAKPLRTGASKNVVSEEPLTIALKARSTYLTDIRTCAHVTPISELATAQWPPELTEEIGETAQVDWLIARLGEDAVNPPALSKIPHYEDLPELPRWPGSVPRSLGPLVPLATDAGPEEWSWQAHVLLGERQGSSEDPFVRPYYTATDMVHLAEDSESFLANQRRPIPSKPSRAARLGTNMHAQIAHHYTEPATLDIDSLMDIPSSDVDMNAGQEGLLYQAFVDSPWASCQPMAIEQSLEIVVAGHIIRCTIDAVLDTSEMEGKPPITIVDWKSGRRPAARDLPSRELQLALYRLAWSRAHKVPLSQIGACFVYLNETESRRELEAGKLTEEEITERIAAALDV